MKSYTKQIFERIESSEIGTGFTASDFIDIADYKAVSKSLERLEDAGKIRRVLRGVYDFPNYSHLLNEYESPSPMKIAQAIARNYNWTIIPSGEIGLNQLGLSTQVVANWIFISDGPYKEYQIGNIKIQFKHSTNKNITGMSYKTAMIIQVLKALGKTHVYDSTIRKLGNGLTCDEKENLYHETLKTTIWMRPIIREICQK
jgi:hypothetical protein